MNFVALTGIEEQPSTTIHRGNRDIRTGQLEQSIIVLFVNNVSTSSYYIIATS